ncbi:hypothetical protein PUNSTDRAFT_67037, partial [Punctularia strigosozonata HHB-11173 SS5]|uniref:uncharacterized protein n=1 Tax=Punctularia strigosozonata (strain HHB-11173) TaxID=741275 RepID=UPI000441828B
ELWFEDGNIVISSFFAPDTLFRVHRSILSLNSVVFRDMFALACSGPGSGCPTFEGYPLIQLADDLDDIRHFLGALYHRSYFQKGIDMHLDVVAGMLRMATKYIVTDLRKDLIAHMELLYPLSLKEFRATVEDGSHIDDDGHSFVAVQIARESNIPSILPAALYHCCELPVQSLLDGVEFSGMLGPRRVRLPASDLRACLLARGKLIKIKAENIDAFLWDDGPSASCRDPQGCSECLRCCQDDERQNGYFDTCDIFTRRLRSVYHGTAEGDFCYKCQAAWKRKEEEELERTWRELPAVFGLEDWAELEKQSRCM